MNLNDFQKRLLWGLGILFILILWVTFPLIFKEWVFSILVKPPFTPEAFATLGPIGDIFGGLTAFFTSLTLIIVMYSAYLQREANIDARKAMAKQLKQAEKAAEDQLNQAKKATEEQLVQVREATEEQLRQARESTKQQLDLAQATHDAQLKETIYSNFLNTYNSLMNYKLSKYNALEVIVSGRVWRAEEIFKEISFHFLGCKNIFNLSLNQKQIGDLYNETLIKIAGRDKGLAEINSYFLIYESLFNLIERSKISDDEKFFFRRSISNTMSTHEQLTLLWAGVNSLFCSELIKNTGIFNQFYGEYMMPFIVQYYEKSSFSNPEILRNWDRFVNNQNPA